MAIAGVFQFQISQHFVRATLGFAARHAVQLARQRHIIGAAQTRDERVGFGHVADGAAQRGAVLSDDMSQDAAATR